MAASPLAAAGLSPGLLEEVDRLVVGCGGIARELLHWSGRASSLAGHSGQRLSAADLLIGRTLSSGLLDLFPGSGGYCEDLGPFGRGLGPEVAVRWLLDPLDGTRPALLGGAFGICAAALVGGPDGLAGGVGRTYVPALGALYRGVIEPGRVEATLNGEPVRVPAPAREELRHSYVAVGSDWGRFRLRCGPLKLSAVGATAVHITQVVHPESDVAAAAITRYRSYDAAAALIATSAAGCALFPLDRACEVPGPEPLPLLPLLEALLAAPAELGPPLLVAHPSLPGVLRNSGAD